jgi:hypothetical protein
LSILTSSPMIADYAVLDDRLSVLSYVGVETEEVVEETVLDVEEG